MTDYWRLLLMVIAARLLRRLLPTDYCPHFLLPALGTKGLLTSSGLSFFALLQGRS